MKLTRIIRARVAMLTCFSMLSTQLVHAAGVPPIPAGSSPAATVRDVSLEENGVLRGQVLDVQGAPLSGIQVSLLRQGKSVAQTSTDTAGNFAVGGLAGGVYTVATPVGTNVYRAWSPRTAPPSASPMALIVPDETVVRGNFGTGALGWLANPWVLAAIVAAAIAIPLALDDDDDAS